MGQVLDQCQEIIVMADEKAEAIRIHGAAIKYGLPIKGESNLFRTQETVTFLNQLRQPRKERLPVLDLWSAKYKIVVADFDELPAPFIEWSDFRKYISFYYGRMGLVLESPSGKAKVIFVVKLPENQAMNHSIARDTLNWLLREEERSVIDRTDSANCRLFINEKMYREIRSKINLLPIYAGILDSAEDNPVESQLSHVWNFLPRDAEQLKRFEGILTTKAQWFLARFVLGSAKLALKEIDLPQPYIIAQAAREGEEAPSLPALSAARKSLVKLGLLELTNEKYCPGGKGKSYRAVGVMKEVCEDILAHFETKNESCSTNLYRKW